MRTTLRQRGAAHHDFAIGLQRAGQRPVFTSEEVDCDDTAGAKLGIELAIRFQLRHGHIALNKRDSRHGGRPRQRLQPVPCPDDDDLAVGTQHDCPCVTPAQVILCNEGERHPAAVTEGCVQAAVGQETRQRHLLIAGPGRVCLAHGENLAVGLNGHGKGNIGHITEIRGRPPPFGKRRIERAVPVIASQGKISARRTGHDDLAVGLDGHVMRSIHGLAEIGRDVPQIAAETSIQRTVGMIPDQQEVIVGHAGDENLAIGLDNNGPAGICIPAKIIQHKAAVAKARIQDGKTAVCPNGGPG